MKKLKKLWLVLWGEFPILGLVYGIIGALGAFGSYKLYIGLTYASSRWLTFLFWIRIVFLAIVALLFIGLFLAETFRYIEEIADAIKYDDPNENDDG